MKTRVILCLVLGGFSCVHKEQTSNSNGVVDLVNSPKHPSATIDVCFESHSSRTASCTSILQKKLEKEFGRTSIMLNFQDSCEASPNGVHIVWQKQKTNAIARHLNQRLVRYDLNLICEDFSESETPILKEKCIDKDSANFCLLNVGLHEFMHAIGFAHEDLRPENASRWQAMVFAGDQLHVLTEYDPKSIMNFLYYGAIVHSQELSLSDLDVIAIDKFYGDDFALPQEKCSLPEYVYEKNTGKCLIKVPTGGN